MSVFVFITALRNYMLIPRPDMGRLQFEAVFNLVAFRKAFPEFCSCLAHYVKAMLRVGVPRGGIFIGKNAEEADLPPQAGKVAAAAFNAHAAEAHAVYIDNREAAAAGVFLEQYVAGREVAVQYAGLVHGGGISGKGLNYGAAFFGVGVAEFVEPPPVRAARANEIAVADKPHVPFFDVCNGGGGVEAGGLYAERVFVGPQPFWLADKGVHNPVERVRLTELLDHEFRAVHGECAQRVAVPFLEQHAAAECGTDVFNKRAHVSVVGVYQNFKHTLFAVVRRMALIIQKVCGKISKFARNV